MITTPVGGFKQSIELRLVALFVLVFFHLFQSPISKAAQAGAQKQRVWFCPDDDTPDLLNMFSSPALWRRARSKIDVFKLGPQHFELNSSLRLNTLQQLANVDAFKELERWNIALAAEEGSIKEWDCTGLDAAKVTIRHVQNAYELGGHISIVAMDEPLVSGLGACRLRLTEIAENTRRYGELVTRGSKNIEGSKSIALGDIEPYPSVSAIKLESWIEALSDLSMKLSFFHLDIDLHYLHVHPEINLRTDLRNLRRVARRRGIPLGIIVWSGNDPVESDAVYYREAMELVRLIRASIDPTTEIVFQSWVRRSKLPCEAASCEPTHCLSAELTYCGGKSVPLNLPEGDSRQFSHTRLVNDALAILRSP